MREYVTAVDDYIADLNGMVARHLVWIEAKNRDTGALEATGFWNGIDIREFTIGGVTRTYYGAGALLGVSPIRAGIGLNVRMHRLSLSGIPPEVLNMIHAYDTRLAPIEVHRALYHPETRALVAEPHRVLKGTVEGMEVPTPEEGGSAAVTITVASAARSLTRGLTIKKSNSAQRTIDPDDDGRLYASISGAVGVFWGKWNQRGTPPPTSTAPPPGENDYADSGGRR